MPAFALRPPRPRPRWAWRRTASRRGRGSAACPFLELNPAGNDAGARRGGRSCRSRAPRSSRNISTRPAGAALGERRLLAGGRGGAVEVRRLLDWFLVKFDEEVTGYLVTEKIYKRFMTPRAGRRPAGHERHPRRAHQCALSSALYRLADRQAELAGRRRADLCRSGGGGPSLGGGLSRRRAMGRGRNGEALVRADEIPAVLPRAPGDRVPGMAPAAHYANLDF